MPGGKLLHRWQDPDIWSEVRALAEDGTGLWAGTFIGVFHRTPDFEWRPVSAFKALALAPGAKNRFWAGLRASPGATPAQAEAGIVDLGAGAGTNQPRRVVPGLPAMDTTAILEDSRGLLWVGRARGEVWARPKDWRAPVCRG